MHNKFLEILWYTDKYKTKVGQWYRNAIVFYLMAKYYSSVLNRRYDQISVTPDKISEFNKRYVMNFTLISVRANMLLAFHRQSLRHVSKLHCFYHFCLIWGTKSWQHLWKVNRKISKKLISVTNPNKSVTACKFSENK